MIGFIFAAGIVFLPASDPPPSQSGLTHGTDRTVLEEGCGDRGGTVRPSGGRVQSHRNPR